MSESVRQKRKPEQRSPRTSNTAKGSRGSIDRDAQDCHNKCCKRNVRDRRVPQGPRLKLLLPRLLLITFLLVGVGLRLRNKSIEFKEQAGHGEASGGKISDCTLWACNLVKTDLRHHVKHLHAVDSSDAYVLGRETEKRHSLRMPLFLKHVNVDRIRMPPERAANVPTAQAHRHAMRPALACGAPAHKRLPSASARCWT